MPIGQDEDIRIYELPEAQELTAGMKVAVDSETDGTKSFDLSNLAGKVDEPETAPEAGQVLTFDGSENTWANPPEGVYVINYSDVTSYNDIDTERAGSQPTFIKIDSSVPLTVQVISGTTTINMENQIMQLTDYNVNNAWHVFRGYNMGSFPGNFPTADRVGSNYHFEVVLQIFRPEVTQNTKLWSVFGDYMDGRNVFNTEPQPYTVSYNNGKGGDISGKTGRSTAVQFTASNGEYRKNLLMPYEIQSHDFSTDTTPEQIQFMGWGATSNRAGYKNMLTASHGFDSTNYPTQTPTVNFTRYLMADPTSNYDANQVQMSAGITVKSSDGQNTQSWAGNFVPTPDANKGYLKYWTDTKGGHMDWTSVSEVPASTSSNAGQVLGVNSDGTTGWTTIASSPFVLVDRSASGWYSTIPPIVAAGKIPMFYDPYTYEGVQRNILYVYQYIDTSSNYVFMGTGVKIPDFTPSPKFFYVTYTLDTSTGSGGITGCDANGIGEETINSTSRLSGDTLSIDNNRSYKITNTSILAKSNLTIKIEDVATADYAANVSIELTPTTDMTLTVKKWNTTLKYSVAAGNQLTAGKTYQVTAFGGCWTVAEFSAS